MKCRSHPRGLGRWLARLVRLGLVASAGWALWKRLAGRSAPMRRLEPEVHGITVRPPSGSTPPAPRPPSKPTISSAIDDASEHPEEPTTEVPVVDGEDLN
ncbi:MAG: hypothetical protein ACT4OS_07780 [Acidimicrobiales bacterium]